MNERVIQMLAEGTVDTVYMTLVSTLFGYIIGLPVGVILTVSDKDGIKPNAVLYRILDVIINIMRSIPFLILLILLIPFTRFLVGKSYGTTATIVPLTISAAPYIARMVESSLKEVSPGVIEAARSMGASNWTIVFRVLLVEAKTSLIVGATIMYAVLATFFCLVVLNSFFFFGFMACPLFKNSRPDGREACMVFGNHSIRTLIPVQECRSCFPQDHGRSLPSEKDHSRHR